MQTSLDRYLRDEGYTHSILRDKEFVKCRKVLNGKAIELHEKGKGKRPMKADPINAAEEEILWKSGVLGSENPVSLIYTIFFLFSQHFGTRGQQEHHQINVQDLKIVRDPATTSITYVGGRAN